jgi:glycosyltransferase involved in cell wall biosynthesis
LNSRVDERIGFSRSAPKTGVATSSRSDRKKLCIVAPSHWETRLGGAEYQIQMLLERLLDLDLFEIHYLTRRAPASSAGYRVHAIGSGRPPGGAFVLDAPKLWGLLKAIRPDVIYQRVACAYTGVAAGYANAHHCRMVWHVSSDRDLDPALRQISASKLWHKVLTHVERSCVDYGARNSSAVIVQTRHQGELLLRNFGRAAAAQVANFHPEATERLAKPADRVRLCWIANLKPLKQPHLFLELARRFMDRPQLEFIMIGDRFGGAEAQARFEADLRAAPNVRYMGRLPNESVNELLASSHLLVNTSDFEGFSNTFIQAWLRGAVVVSLRVDPDGVFQDERYGVCARGNYEELVRAVARLAENAPLRTAIATRARALAQQSFSRANIDRLVEVLDPAWSGSQSMGTDLASGSARRP